MSTVLPFTPRACRILSATLATAPTTPPTTPAVAAAVTSSRRRLSSAKQGTMTRETQTPAESERDSDKRDVPGSGARHPRRLIFAPGDMEAPSSPPDSTTNSASHPSSIARPLPIPSNLSPEDDPTAPATGSGSGTSTPSANAAVVAHASRAHQFISNPPLTFSHLDSLSPLRQFHAWFRDARLPASSAPETCTLATAAMPSGRVSARVVYLKELDERGWVVYSNWGSRAGKGGQVFGSAGDGEGVSGFGGADEDVGEGDGLDGLEGNRWAALTFHWPGVERQVRVEGLIEPLSREESETYWRVRERGSQVGAWASQQSKVLWSTEPRGTATTSADGETGKSTAAAAAAADADGDDGRAVLEGRVEDVENRFAGTEQIPLPPFWGGVRIVPESVEFWQGRKSRLHDRFRYVRVHSDQDEGEKAYRWRIQRLSP